MLLPPRTLRPPLSGGEASLVGGRSTRPRAATTVAGTAPCRSSSMADAGDRRSRRSSPTSTSSSRLGAGHIHFGDPDFLNRPQHARRVAEALHERIRELSFDATIKVSHLLRHPSTHRRARRARACVFVVSAFESTSDVVLDHLDKGHRGVDLAEAVTILRAAGVEPRPSLLPFTPWTTARRSLDLLDFVVAERPRSERRPRAVRDPTTAPTGVAAARRSGSSRSRARSSASTRARSATHGAPPTRCSTSSQDELAAHHRGGRGDGRAGRGDLAAVRGHVLRASVSSTRAAGGDGHPRPAPRAATPPQRIVVLLCRAHRRPGRPARQLRSRTRRRARCRCGSARP